MTDIIKEKRDGNHRWTDQETELLLQYVLDAIQNDITKYERPTARTFYIKNCTSDSLKHIEWQYMKYKMRYLKQKFLKAKRWRDQVGSELFKTDKTHVEARITTICPYYDKLDVIFGHLQPDDPINITSNSSNDLSSINAMNEGGEILSARNQSVEEDDCNADDDDDDDPNDTIVPKREIEDSFQSRSSITQNISPSPKTNRQSGFEIYEMDTTIDEMEANEEKEQQINDHLKYDLERSKLAFDRNKLNFEQKCYEEEMKWKRSQLSLEREKFEFEKRRIFDEQHLRKYEIDKQFEIKKLEIEKDERLKQLELELKYKYKSFDEGEEFT